jgi:phosphoribosyl-AMP cyclohydrolase / phosphoribosyl-ATP pyrophosphohydrolase
MPLDAVRFGEDGLVVAVAQEVSTGSVLMVAYMNREALERTLRSGEAHYFSRSRQRLWRKGEESGTVLHVEGIQADCDGDALLLAVHAGGPACHTGRRSCFPNPVPLLDQLAHTLADRNERRPAGSYTAGLLAQGREAILRKVGEEAIEVILAGQSSDQDALVGEVADLWFHTLVLLADRGLGPKEVLSVLASRARASQTTRPGS